MKKIAYILILLSLTFGLNGCGGSGDDGDKPGGGDPEIPEVPADVKSKATFTLKSDITGVQDAGLKDLIKHARLYIFDKDQKLQSVTKYTSTSEMKSVELTKGNYTIVLVGNVPEDANISKETIGTSINDMSVQLTKKTDAANYTPLEDVLFAKNTLTVEEKDVEVSLPVKRTLSSTKVEMTDKSGQISEVGVLVPGVRTTMGFGDSKWINPGTVFVPMTTTTARSVSRAETTLKNYTVSMNISVVKAVGETTTKIQCNIVAKNDKAEVIMAQVVDVPVETKPNVDVIVNIEVNESTPGSGQIEISVDKVSVKDETGKQEDLPKEDVEVKVTDITIHLRPGDWETGNNEDIEIGDKEDWIRPGGSGSEWETGNDESITIQDSTKISR